MQPALLHSSIKCLLRLKEWMKVNRGERTLISKISWIWINPSIWKHNSYFFFTGKVNLWCTKKLNSKKDFMKLWTILLPCDNADRSIEMVFTPRAPIQNSVDTYLGKLQISQILYLIYNLRFNSLRLIWQVWLKPFLQGRLNKNVNQMLCFYKLISPARWLTSSSRPHSTPCSLTSQGEV